MPAGELEPVLEQGVGEQQRVALVGPGHAELPAPGLLGAAQIGDAAGSPVARGPQAVRGPDLVGLDDRHEAGLGHREVLLGCSCGRLWPWSAHRWPGVDETVDDRVEKGLPGGLDDVLRDADRGPDVLAVAGVDEDPGHRSGALARVEHPHPVVDEVDRRRASGSARRWPGARPSRGR